MTTIEMSNKTEKVERRRVHVERWKRKVRKLVKPYDQEIIHVITGKSQSFISRVLSGERKDEEIWVIAREIVSNRQELIDQQIERLKARKKGKGEE